jgi:hypothetical protein
MTTPNTGTALSLLLNVTAASGTTPTLDVEVQWSNDGTVWASADPVDSFTQITGVKAVVKTFPPRAAFYRLRWTIAGTTPSFTFTATEFITV